MNKPGITLSISGGLVAMALIWGGGIQAKVEEITDLKKAIFEIQKSISNIEGYLEMKKNSGK